MQAIRECKLLDLREHDGRFYIRFGSGDDFADKLAAFKKAFAINERRWHEQDKQWSVWATPENEAKLAAIFPNAAECFAILRAQLPLF